MAASVNDKLDQVTSSSTGRPVVTTLGGAGHSIGGTSVTIAAATNWSTTTGIHFSIYETTTVGGATVKDSSTQTDWKGTLASTTISNMTITGGTDRAYSAGAIVEITPTARWAKDLYDWGIAEHDQAGIHALGATATLTSTKVITALTDTNGNELLKVTATASAVNEVTLANAATGNSPSLTATGGDTNIGINLVGKGTGEIQFGGTPVSGSWQSWTPTLSGRLNDSKWTKACAYKQIGKTIHFRMKLTANAATPMDGGSTDAQFTLPGTAASGYAGTDQTACIGRGGIYDAGTAVFTCGVYLSSSSNAVGRIRVDSAGSSYVGIAEITSSVPMTWANTDEITVSGTYEAA